MATVFKLISVVMGFAFPSFLIAAIRAKNTDENTASKYIAGACVSFGVIVMTIMLLLPNS